MNSIDIDVGELLRPRAHFDGKVLIKKVPRRHMISPFVFLA